MPGEYNNPPIHWKLDVWAKDKTTGKIPAIIIPSIYCTVDETTEFESSGKFQKSYDAFKQFCIRNNPNLEFI